MRYGFELKDESFELREYEEKELLLDYIRQAKEAMELAYAKFNLVSEPDLIDCYIYELKATQLKYEYLMQQAKQQGIMLKTI